MAGIIVIGSQWGDEGKGKLIDVFSKEADYVVRSHGGANAGHTLVVGDQKFVLHLMPSGILHKHIKCIISAGVVLDIEAIQTEIQKLRESGHLFSNDQLMISESCTLLLPFHKALDQARESDEAGVKIGTTGRGIGPAYEDRAARRALVFGDLFQPATLKDKVAKALREKSFLLEKMYGQSVPTVDELHDQLMKAAEFLAPYRCRDTSYVVQKALKSGKRILFEGAQGALLDPLHGTYPYVTSSSTLAGSACTGTGIGPHSIEKVVGITKAYVTRVGEGPFPTELAGEIGERLQVLGGEIGSTTGRKRRVGWLDMVALRFAIRINGVTTLALTKLDVFSGMDQIGVCTAYKYRGEILKDVPLTNLVPEDIEPVIEWLPGWKAPISSSRSVKDLPPTARDYVQFIGNEAGTPIDLISVGPGRDQTLWIKPLFS